MLGLSIVIYMEMFFSRKGASTVALSRILNKQKNRSTTVTTEKNVQRSVASIYAHMPVGTRTAEIWKNYILPFIS